MKKTIMTVLAFAFVFAAFAQPVKTTARPDFELTEAGFTVAVSDSWGDKDYWSYGKVNYEELEQFLKDVQYEGWKISDEDFFSGYTGNGGLKTVRKNADQLDKDFVYVSFATDSYGRTIVFTIYYDGKKWQGYYYELSNKQSSEAARQAFTNALGAFSQSIQATGDEVARIYRNGSN